VVIAIAIAIAEAVEVPGGGLLSTNPWSVAVAGCST
jgi:hypothetical protein